MYIYIYIYNMTILKELDNLINDLKGENRTDKLKKEMIEKYNEIFKISEKLFDKIYEKDLSNDEINIVKTMIRMKIQRDNGVIEKLDADKNIGELLCKTYVEPMLKDKKK